MSKSQSLARVAVAYVIAFGAGAAWLYLGPDTDHLWLDGLIADLIATAVVFVASRLHQNSSFYDAYWSVLPPLLVGYWWAEGGLGAGNARPWLVLGVIAFWSVRLTGNWIYAFPGLHHEDWRYPMLRERAGKAEAVVDLMGIHVFPTLQVFWALVPAYIAVTRTGEDVGWLDWAAVLVGVASVVLSFAADLQMYRFARTRQPGQAMDRGLWSWSRHPNYFGEFGFWVSLALFGLATLPDHWWLTFGAIGILAMFEGASIPMMEQRSLERRPEYQAVIDRVSRFFPRPPRKVPA
jgi:steroid 5-alpha reductase family enzyme